MIAYINNGSIATNDIEKCFITDYLSPSSLIEASSASYLVSKEILSPMGANLAGFKEKSEASKVQSQLGGDLLSWDLVKQEINIQK